MPITLISDSSVEEKETEIEILPPSSSSRRAPSRRKKGSLKNHPKTVAALENKVHVLTQKWKVIPFVPNKALDFSRHEENLRRLGLWEFAHFEFDRKIRADLLAKLILTFNQKDRCSSVDGVKVWVTQVDLARALSLWKKPKLVDSDEEEEEEEEEAAWPGDFLAFLEEFVSNWMLLHEDTWIPPKEVVNWTGLIKEGHPEKVNWTKLIWFMVRRELSMGVDLENCYYASHLQQLIRFQRNELLMEKSSMEVKLGECVEVSHDGESENVQQSVMSIASVQSEETVVNLGNVSDADNIGSLAHGDITNDRVENPETAGDHVEKLVEQIGSPDKAVECVESPKNAVDHVDVPETVVENPEEAVEDHANTDGMDFVNLLSIACEQVQKLEAAVDLAGDLVENMNVVGGPSSIFGNDIHKRELEHGPEMPSHSLNNAHKRMRTEGPSLDQKPPDLDQI